MQRASLLRMVMLISVRHVFLFLMILCCAGVETSFLRLDGAMSFQPTKRFGQTVLVQMRLCTTPAAYFSMPAGHLASRAAGNERCPPAPSLASRPLADLCAGRKTACAFSQPLNQGSQDGQNVHYVHVLDASRGWAVCC